MNIKSLAMAKTKDEELISEALNIVDMLRNVYLANYAADVMAELARRYAARFFRQGEEKDEQQTD